MTRFRPRRRKNNTFGQPYWTREQRDTLKGSALYNWKSKYRYMLFIRHSKAVLRAKTFLILSQHVPPTTLSFRHSGSKQTFQGATQMLIHIYETPRSKVKIGIVEFPILRFLQYCITFSHVNQLHCCLTPLDLQGRAHGDTLQYRHP